MGIMQHPRAFQMINTVSMRSRYGGVMGIMQHPRAFRMINTVSRRDPDKVGLWG